MMMTIGSKHVVKHIVYGIMAGITMIPKEWKLRLVKSLKGRFFVVQIIQHNKYTIKLLVLDFICDK